MRASLLSMLGLMVALPSSARAEELLISVDGSKVIVDGKVAEEHATQRLKLKLEHGSHQVRVEHDGFEAWTGKVDATAKSAGNLINVQLQLAKAEPVTPVAATTLAVEERPALKTLPPLRLALQDLQQLIPDRKIQPHAVRVVGESLLGEVRKLSGLQAVAVSEVREMVQFEATRQASGACDDEPCATAVASALGVDELLAGSVGQLGETKVFTMRRLDLKTGKVNASVTRTLKSDNGEELLSVIGPSVEQLFPERDVREGQKRGVSPEVAKRLNPPPLPRWVTMATGGAAVAALATAGVFAGLASGAEGRFNTLMSQSTKDPVPGASVNQAMTDYDSNRTRMTGLLITAGGLAVAAGVEALFTDWQELRKDERRR